jgi:hypothetical protein
MVTPASVRLSFRWQAREPKSRPETVEGRLIMATKAEITLMNILSRPVRPMSDVRQSGARPQTDPEEGTHMELFGPPFPPRTPPESVS